MLGYLLRRVFAAIPVMGVVALVVFMLLRLTPGDPAAVLAGDNATPAQLERIRTSLGLNEPLYVQFITWINKLLHGDLGVSLISNVPVLNMIGQRIEPSISLALSFIYVALIARMTRASMLDVLGEDYVRTARAKGLGEIAVLFRHALRNAAVPVITVIGTGFALLISGVVVTESVFNIPGIGRLTVDAVLARDYPVIQAMILLTSLLYVTINLLIDVAYTLLDPRIRY